MKQEVKDAQNTSIRDLLHALENNTHEGLDFTDWQVNHTFMFHQCGTLEEIQSFEISRDREKYIRKCVSHIRHMEKILGNYDK